MVGVYLEENIFGFFLEAELEGALCIASVLDEHGLGPLLVVHWTSIDCSKGLLHFFNGYEKDAIFLVHDHGNALRICEADASPRIQVFVVVVSFVAFRPPGVPHLHEFQFLALLHKSAGLEYCVGVGLSDSIVVSDTVASGVGVATSSQNVVLVVMILQPVPETVLACIKRLRIAASEERHDFGGSAGNGVLVVAAEFSPGLLHERYPGLALEAQTSKDSADLVPEKASSGLERK